MKNILKIITVISYCLIIMSSTHFGAPLFFMLLIWLASGNVLYTVQSVLIIAFLIYIIASCLRAVKKRDLYIFPAGGMLLLLPIIEQCSWLKKFENEYFFEDRLFAETSGLFLLFFVLMTVSVFRSAKTELQDYDKNIK